MANLDTITFNAVMREDADFSIALALKDSAGAAINLSGYTFDAGIADNAGAAGFITATPGNPSTGGIAVQGTAGGVLTVRIALATLNTQIATNGKRSGWWTVTANDGTDTSILLEGAVTFVRSAL